MSIKTYTLPDLPYAYDVRNKSHYPLLSLSLIRSTFTFFSESLQYA